MDKIDEISFLEKLIDVFPEIEKNVSRETGEITIQIGCLTSYAQTAINNNDTATALKCFQFVDGMLDKVIFEIENSLVISFIGLLKFDKNPDLYNLFPARLKEFKTALDDHYKSFAIPHKIKKKIKKTSKQARKTRR